MFALKCLCVLLSLQLALAAPQADNFSAFLHLYDGNPYGLLGINDDYTQLKWYPYSAANDIKTQWLVSEEGKICFAKYPEVGVPYRCGKGLYPESQVTWIEPEFANIFMGHRMSGGGPSLEIQQWGNVVKGLGEGTAYFGNGNSFINWVGGNGGTGMRLQRMAKSTAFREHCTGHHGLESVVMCQCPKFFLPQNKNVSFYDTCHFNECIGCKTTCVNGYQCLKEEAPIHHDKGAMIGIIVGICLVVFLMLICIMVKKGFYVKRCSFWGDKDDKRNYDALNV